MLPDLCADIVFDGSALVVAGPATQAVAVPAAPDGFRFGVRFRVAAAGAVLGLGVDELLDTTVGVGDLWGREGRVLEERLASCQRSSGVELLLGAVADRAAAASGDALVRRAALLIGDGCSVTDAGREVGLGDRHLRRRFAQAVGYGPATYARILRFQRFLARAATTSSLVDLAHSVGYADQSHLSRECRRLSGRTPSALVAEIAGVAGDKSVLFKDLADVGTKLGS